MIDNIGYCAHCIYSMDDYRIPKPYYVNNLKEAIRPETFIKLIDAIAEYGSVFRSNDGVHYGGYASTFVNGTALCQSHSIIEIDRSMRR